MKPLRTMAELIEKAVAFAPTKAIASWLKSYGGNVYGGVFFKRMPGWIVEAASGRLIGIWLDEQRRIYIITYPNKLPKGAKRVKGPLL